MSNENHYIETLIAMMKEINYVQPGDVPNIDLYMDQVTTFMDEYLESSKRYSDDKLLTKTMINNYTKNSLLPSPEKKKYSKDHIYILLFIYYLKNILSISDTKAILNPLTTHFFKADRKKESDGISLEDIYAEIFKIEKEQSSIITKDVIRKYEKSCNSFADVEDEEEAEILRKFAFVSMLCFDVHMKKQMIGKLVDKFFSEEEPTTGSKKKE